MLREQDPPDALIVHTAVFENELYQTRLRSNQDPLNFGIKLNNKIATLRSVIESIENQPTDRPARSSTCWRAS
jgi:hypothetical protein